MLPLPTEEKEIDINGFLKDLENQIIKVDKEIYTAETLERLNVIWREYNGEDKLISSKEIAEKLKNAPPEEKIHTGFKDFDDIINGFRLKQVVVIAGATKNGKTSWAVEMTSRMADQNPMWLPFEESSEELVQKFLDRGEQPPHFYAPERMSGNTMLWVEKKIIEAKAKFNSKVIFIDHLHFIVDMGGENMSVQIGKTMRELKRIAKFWNVCIFLIAHLKKTKMEVQPELDDLRDSSFIAQEADTVMMVWRKTEILDGQIEVTNEVNVSIQANRRTGKTGNVKFLFENGKFIISTKKYDEPQHKAKKEYDDWS